MNINKRPDCNIQGCEDCFAKDKKGRCKCLVNTKFKNDKCPFYKSVIKYSAELEKLEKLKKGGN